MADAVASATSGWAHLPFLVPRLIVGFAIVLIVLPVPWSLLYPTAVVTFNLPIMVYVQYWNWIASDINHLWLIVLASIVVGFFAVDFINRWGTFLMGSWVKKKLKPRSDQLANYAWPGYLQRFQDLDTKELENITKNAKFRVWLLSYRKGSPVRYLDWHGFNSELATATANSLSLLVQLWIVWGLLSFLGAAYAGSLSSWFTQPLTWTGALFEWAAIVLFFGLLTWAAYMSAKGWNHVKNETWMSLYDMWNGLVKDGKEYPDDNV